ncbi:murein L,D-transpeptidase family protein [Noviherbaspirillum sp. UKPF54]|uniref:L,D-transpeptidase family protein n=1 Tax=Noviherbaspirillum sp. UKPF54 TaxID=2601898 RepID=UPI001FEF5EEC|nr:L,D-transpeptidase family protein [Noviherbaspirillum sp. UKPF54]
MYRSESTDRRITATAKRALMAGLSWLLAAGGGALPHAALAGNSAEQVVQAALASNKPDPEALLIGVYKELGANRLRAAQEKADQLVEAYPNFRLGHLIRGDLLLMHTRPVKTLGATDGPQDKLKNLRDEAMVRLKSLRERPDPALIPRSLLQLREDQKHALVVDAKRSRLYVYENQGGRPKFVTDYYISQGKLGVNKLKEGDQKTPVGIYYITSHLSGARLPDFYGSGALPINYPNEWDKLHGRSGSGIWLHGTPSDSYSRPPLSSDGCVVLTNPDLYQLANSVEIGKTPVVISESVEFVNKSKWDSDRHTAARLVEDWRRDMESRNATRVMENYSRKFKSDRGEDVKAWLARHLPFMSGVKNLSVRLRDATYFFYPGHDDMIVSTFTEETSIGRNKSLTRKRQYWAKEGAQWKIIYELNI